MTKTNEIDGMKAFEMGNCRFCNSPYIIGRMISKDDSPQLYLVQNDEIDIYENYGENSWAKLDYFLLSDEMEDDENDLPALEPYVLCGKCGSIHAKENLNAAGCKCGEEFQSVIYKVTESASSKTGTQAENNIHFCPHGGHQSQSGIIRNLNLGKDEGTALTSQILLEAMDEDSKASDTETRNPLPPTPSKKLDLKDLFTKKKSEIPQKVKQFLAFSDSRQQASFAALFFSRNYKRIMQKRLIWEVLQKNNFEDVAFSRLISKLTNLIEENDLFPEQASHEKSAWLTALVELLKVDGDYDGEKLGLYYFDLNVDDIKEGLSDAENLTGFKNFIFGQEHDCNFTAEEILALIKGICAVFKNVPAIDYRDSDLMKKEKEEDLQYRRFNNFVQLKSDSKKTNIYSLLPISSTANNKVVRYVMKMCNCDSDTAKSIIENVFNALINYSEDETVQPLFYYDQNNRAYQIKADKYILRSYRKHACYRCKTCGRLTPYNIGNHCPTDKCEGILEQVDPDEVLKTNYFRNQYMHRKIERIVAKEHTAQLDRKTAKQYQNDFKNKKINILSCSTTFEMGIDIGDLETVFMRNIPPSPANYVQRAGRAGRRKDSAAYILTYCSVSSHDYTYFCEPEKMISGIIRPPYFNINNSKVIERHLMSCYLGSFFKNNPGYYKKLSDMFFEENGPTGVHRFNEYISSHPEDLNRYVNEKVIPEPEYARYRNFEHFDAEGGQDVKLSWMMEDLNRIRKEYQEAIESAKHSEEFKEGQYCQAALDNLKATPVINALSRYSVIPKYGFPVDVVELKIYEHGRPVYRDDANRGGLNRDLKIAISEYAPDSEVIMDGTKYTSKYVVTPQNGEFPKKYFYTCPICQKLNIFLSKTNAETCQYCHSDIEERLSDYFIEPVYGFRTGPGKAANI